MPFILNGNILKVVPSYKYLGVTLDEELSLESHVRTLINNTRFKSIFLYKLKECMSQKSLLCLYISHVLSAIDYCDILYVGAKKGSLDELQRLQNKCLKTCLAKHILTPTEQVHALANLPTLFNRRVYHTRTYAHKRAKNPIFRRQNVRETRQSSAPVLAYSIIKCSSYEHSPEVICAQEWNALVPELRNIDDYDLFKEENET